MKRIAITLSVVFAVIVLSSAAGAQYTEGYAEKRYNIGFGFFHPIDPNLRGGRNASPEGASDKWVDLKFTYALKTDSEDRPETYIALDWIAPAGNLTELRMTPITINKIFRPRQEKLGNFYLTAGAGVYPLKLKKYGDWSTTKFGVNICGGVEFDSSSRLELTYTWVQPWKDTYTYAVQTGEEGDPPQPVYSYYKMGYSFSGLHLTYTAVAF